LALIFPQKHRLWAGFVDCKTKVNVKSVNDCCETYSNTIILETNNYKRNTSQKRERHMSHRNGSGFNAVVIDSDSGAHKIGEEKEPKVNIFQTLDCVLDLRMPLK